LKIEVSQTNNPADTSYAQIVRASALFGGVQGFIYVVSLIRSKLVALILGTAGIGALSLYQSFIQAAQTITSLGIPTSGVREIAELTARDKSELLSGRIAAVRRLTLLTALLGITLTTTFAGPLSDVLGQTRTLIYDIRILGVGAFFFCLAAGESAVLQGLGRLKDVARTQLVSVVIGAPVLLALCFALGDSGIAPGLAAIAVLSWAVTRYSTRSIGTDCSVPWSTLPLHAGPILKLGAAIACNAAAASAVVLATRALVTREAGLEANGILQAAVTLAGLSSSFLLVVMGTDFFPRLSSAKHDYKRVNQLVNEQTQVATMLATPGLIVTIGLCPWLVQLFYSAEFSDATSLVPWLAVANLLQVCGWPIGLLQMVIARTSTYLLTQIAFHFAQISLVFYLFPAFGVYSISSSMIACGAIYLLVVLAYGGIVARFKFVKETWRQLLLSFTLTASAVAAAMTLGVVGCAVACSCMAAVAGVISAKKFSMLLPSTHKLQPYLKWTSFTSTRA
jgi:antigen flippase